MMYEAELFLVGVQTVMQFSYVLWFNGEVLDRPNNE